jgi:hypothetical protein
MSSLGEAVRLRVHDLRQIGEDLRIVARLHGRS